ncbi:TetR/AcrR family transcriptional regulator [Paenibacillus koleovorans]|uniref:TetR/AcrR family transcriptional regulator n=1 Tax=Paenibacillus koleovorans TaxID=121608 RepID=UPI000FDCAACE|nr:TetR/AcrR family transcriptional regulator [Paenibacillus koleovorans]
MNKLSLRDRKKEATAHALAESAYQLALERGLDGFVVEDVVQRAEYSRRTFANHFACKEEAVVMAAMSFDGVEEAEAELAKMPENATPLDVLYRWLKLQFTADLFRKMRTLVSMSQQHPTLEPYILSLFRRLQREAQEALNELFAGRHPEGYTHLLIGAVYGAILPIIDGSLQVQLPGDQVDETPDVVSFDQYLDRSFGYLRDGF